MHKNELLERLAGHEWDDVEFKSGQRAVPKSAYETVCAFANTRGGHLVFGVREGVDGHEVLGVLNVDKVQNDFLSVLRSGRKLSQVVAASARLVEMDGKALLVFHIPEASREQKPLYLGGDIGKSFIRRGAGDERCTRTEIQRLLRDADSERYDAGVVSVDPERFFDARSLRWYRKQFNDRNLDQDGSTPDLTFLKDWGYVVDTGTELRPTRAAVLLFGASAAFHQLMPGPVVDWQWRRGVWSESMAEERWSDRLVVETNLVEAWRTLAARYVQRAEKPFSIDPLTLERNDLPPGFVTFREAAINLLIHQDYADHTRKAVIRSFDDRMELWNPGDVFASADRILEPGEREVRNPAIVAAFRRIGLGEQAGTGIRTILAERRRLGHVPPTIEDDRARKAFGLTLLEEPLLSAERARLQAELGLQLDDASARVFALACRDGRIGLDGARAATGLAAAEARSLLERLAAEGLVARSGDARRPVFLLHETVQARGRRAGPEDAGGAAPGGSPPTDGLVADGVPSGFGRPSRVPAHAVSLGSAFPQAEAGLSEAQRKIVEVCSTPQSLAAIMAAVGASSRGYFKRRHLDPLLRCGLVRMTHPDRPHHGRQAYVLTDAGLALRSNHAHPVVQ